MSDMKTLSDLAWELAQQQEKVNQTRRKIHQAILDALDKGAGVAQLAKQTGYSKTAIYKIRDCRRQ